MNERHFYAIMGFILLCIIVLMVGIAICQVGIANCQKGIKKILRKIDGKKKGNISERNRLNIMLKQSDIKNNALSYILQVLLSGTIR